MSDDVLMSRLERRYRRLLRALPAWYRQGREEEMVATLVAERQDRDVRKDRVGLAETASVFSLALRTRVAAAGPARPVAIGNAVRLTALFALLAATGLAVASLTALISEIWTLWPRGYQPSATYFVDVVGDLAVPAAFLAIVAGWRTIARILAVVALAPGAVEFLSVLYRGSANGLSLTSIKLTEEFAANATLLLAVLCLLGGFHRAAPKPSAGRWLPVFGLVSLGGLAVGFFSSVVFVPGEVGRILVNRDSLPAWAVLAVGVGYLFAAGFRRVDASGSYAFALAGSSLVVLAGQLSVFVGPTSDFEIRTDPVMVGLYIGQSLALFALAVSLTAVGIRRFRRLDRRRFLTVHTGDR